MPAEHSSSACWPRGRPEGAARAAAAERARIERDLHDGAQPRLVNLAMTLGMARSKLDTDPEAARAMIDEAHSEAKAAVNDLRQLARGIHPAVLTDRGLDAALSGLAAASPSPCGSGWTSPSGCRAPWSRPPTSWWPRR